MCVCGNAAADKYGILTPKYGFGARAVKLDTFGGGPNFGV